MSGPGSRLKHPPPAIAADPVIELCPAEAQFVRVYDPRPPHSPTEMTFRAFGPILRFDHHQLAGGGPAQSEDRGVWYAAYSDLPCAVIEVFADYEAIRTEHHRIAVPQLTRTVRLLDLRDNGSMRAGTVPELSKTGDYDFSWAWARYWYDSHAYDSVDGILWSGARNDGRCVVLFERASSALTCDDCSIPLSHPLLSDELLRISAETGYRLVRT
jgi:hypothetical protein